MKNAIVAPIVGALVVAACSSVQINPAAETATTLQPFNARMGLAASVSVPANSNLVGATLDGQPGFCTPFPAYFVPGEERSVCFLDKNGGGYFSQYYILGTLSSIRYAAHIPYVINGIPPSQARNPYADHYRTEQRQTHDAAVLAAITAECRYEVDAGGAGSQYTPGYSRSLGIAVANNLTASAMNAAARNQDVSECVEARVLARSAGTSP